MCIKVKFLYPKNYKQDISLNNLVDKLIQKTNNYLELPSLIIIEFTKLDNNIYGGIVLTNTIKNRVLINLSLQYKEILYVLSHELLHLHQIQIGTLSYSLSGSYIWNGVKVCSLTELESMTYEQYNMLPWEQDVVKKQHSLLEFLLKN